MHLHRRFGARGAIVVVALCCAALRSAVAQHDAVRAPAGAPHRALCCSLECRAAAAVEARRGTQRGVTLPPPKPYQPHPPTLPQHPTTRPAWVQGAELPLSCRGEWQLVMCSDIPASEAQQLADCCLQHRGTRRPAGAAQQQAGAGVARADLKGGEGLPGGPVEWHYGKCTKRRVAELPTFSRDEDGSTRVRAAPRLSGERAGASAAPAFAAGWGAPHTAAATAAAPRRRAATPLERRCVVSVQVLCVL